MTRNDCLGILVLSSFLLSCGSNDTNACYSPTSNIASAGQSGAVGCACDPSVEEAVCVQGKALFCDYGRWSFGFDGSCTPGPDGGTRSDTPVVDVASTPDTYVTCSLDTECPAGTICQTGRGCAACFSPVVNVSMAEFGAAGCACDPDVDKDVCLQGKAFFCMYGRWVIGEDGPCMPGPDGGVSRDTAQESILPTLDAAVVF